MKTKVTDFLLYRWRYSIGFAVIVLILVALLSLVIFLTPGGISKPEMDSAVTSSQTSVMDFLHPAGSIVNLPYHLLQRLSIDIFGVTTVSIKLASILMGIVSLVALYGVVRLWFKRNVGIITTLLSTTSGLFLLSLQNGDTLITPIFWSSLVLFFGAMLARPSRLKLLWVAGLFVSAALSLYTPFQIYLLVALFATGLIHPHARYIVLNQSKLVLGIGAAFFAILIAPIAVEAFRHPSVGFTLLGWPDTISLQSVWEHAKRYIDVYNTSSSTVLRPAYGLGILLLSALGIYRMFTAKYTAKSYILTIWGICLLPFFFLNQSTITASFVPVMLLMGQGIDFLIASWYRLFPLNPYARVAGLLPLAVLVLGVGLSGVERFAYGYHYNPQAASSYTHDLRLLGKTLKDTDGDVTLLVTSKNKPFYELYAAKSSHHITVTDSVEVALSKPQELIAAGPFHDFIPGTPSEIVVSDTSSDANRFYIYKNNA